MKKTILPILLFALLTYCLPMVSLLLPAAGADDGANPFFGFGGGASSPSSAAPAPTPAPGALTGGKDPNAAPAQTGDSPVILIQNAADSSVLEVPVLDYMIGAAASEMPVNWPDEALKAQAVASHSYALYQRDHADTDKLGGAWFSADPARRQGYMTEEVLRSYWGDAYSENYARLKSLFEPIVDKVLTWEGAPAAACYHAISCGRTEASENVWSEALPYLAGVDSTLDLAAEGYEQTVTYTAQQMYDALTASFAGVDLTAKPGKWFGDAKYTDAGYVQSIQVGGVFAKGTDVRAALGLRSACFTVQYADGAFAVTTKGYGHGVGLSQWGAKNMALTGKSFSEILAAYFPGTALEVLG